MCVYSLNDFKKKHYKLNNGQIGSQSTGAESPKNKQTLLFPDVKILPGYQYFEQHTVYILSSFHVFSERFPNTFKEHNLQELRTQCNSPTYLTFLCMMQPSCPVDSNITNLLGKKL